MWTFLTYYSMLEAAGDPRAADILARGYAQLQE